MEPKVIACLVYSSDRDHAGPSKQREAGPESRPLFARTDGIVSPGLVTDVVTKKTHLVLNAEEVRYRNTLLLS